MGVSRPAVFGLLLGAVLLAALASEAWANHVAVADWGSRTGEERACDDQSLASQAEQATKKMHRSLQEPPYLVEKRDGAIELRCYAGYVMAQISFNGSYARAAGRSFRPLYGYISGQNHTRTSMAMTAPVLAQPDDRAVTIALIQPDDKSQAEDQPLDQARRWTISFILPEGHTLEDSPAPMNGSVTLTDAPAHRVASISFSGRLNERRGEAYRKRLAEWLQANEIEHLGDWKLATYDAPRTPASQRRNEILVTLE